jgi:hypothetical protein
MLTDQKQFGLTPEQVAFYQENGYLAYPCGLHGRGSRRTCGRRRTR